MIRIGVLSDTHGRLDYRVERAFEGVSQILHAGDVCHRRVLDELDLLGVPLHAVEGNCDRYAELGVDLPPVARFTIEGVRFLLLHDRSDAGVVDAQETDVVVFGHSHMPLVERRADGVLWLNPGSASEPRRSLIGRSVAVLDVHDGAVEARIVPLSRFGPDRQASDS